MRVIAASILCVATAFRTNSFNANVQKHTNDGKFPSLTASCDDLENTFNTRLASIQETVDGMDTANPTLSAGAQARLTMRVYGLGRTLRRARECSWVANAEGTESDNAVKVQNMVGRLLEMNPCSEQARAEMEGPVGEGEEARAAAMQRTMSILTSDTCTATQVTTTSAEMAEMNDTDEQLTIEQIEDTEEECANQIEEMTIGEGGSSFVETSYAIERMVRFLIVLAIFVLLVVLCTWVVVWVAMFIISYFTMLLGMLGIYVGIAAWQWEQLLLPPALLACGYDLFMRILNPEIGRLGR